MIELSPQNRTKIAVLARLFSLELLVLFGSQVTGKTHAESDYDIGYQSSRQLGLDEEGTLINKLLSLTKERDERKINLVNIKKAPPLLFYAITDSCQLLYEKEPAIFDRVRSYAFKKYLETRSLYKEKARRLQVSRPT